MNPYRRTICRLALAASLAASSLAAQAQQGLLAILPIGGEAPTLAILDPIVQPLTDAGVLPQGVQNLDLLIGIGMEVLTNENGLMDTLGGLGGPVTAQFVPVLDVLMTSPLSTPGYLFFEGGT
ncbi:MAG: hypothetical protein JJ903_06315, partial [Spongiibacter sp.]